MRGLVFLAVVGVTYAAPAAVIPHGDFVVAPPGHSHIPVTHVARHHTQGELGQVNHGFAPPGQTKKEVSDTSGNVVSVSTYSDVNTDPANAGNTAPVDNFQVNRNTLQKGTGVFYVPVPVRDTPDVTAAKLEFLEAYNAAAIAAATGSTGVGDHQFAIVLGPKPVKDTPEVTAAKLEFVQAYNAAAVAAALAPDNKKVVMAITDHTQGSSGINEDTESITELGPTAEPTSETPLETSIQSDSPVTVFHIHHVPGAVKVPLTPETEAAHDADKGIQGAGVSATHAVDDGSLDKFSIVNILQSEKNQKVVVNSGKNVTYDSESGDVLKKTDTAGPEQVIKMPKTIESEAQGGLLNTATDYSISFKVGSDPKANAEVTAMVDPATSPVVATPALTHSPVPHTFQHQSQGETNQVDNVSSNANSVNTLSDASYSPENVEYKPAVDDSQVNTNTLQKDTDVFHVPVPVRDTPEVIAAKLQFVEAYNAAAIAAATGSTGVGDIIAGPKPVKDTPEVTAAKLKFMEAYNSAAIAAAAGSTGVSDSHIIIVTGLKPVKDTPEVTAAKLKFMEAYNTAAIAAAVAPDDEADQNTESNTELGPAFGEPTNEAVQKTNVQTETPVTVIQVHHVPHLVKAPLPPSSDKNPDAAKEVQSTEDKTAHTVDVSNADKIEAAFRADIQSTQVNEPKSISTKTSIINTEQVISLPATNDTDGIGYSIAYKVGSDPTEDGNVANALQHTIVNNSPVNVDHTADNADDIQVKSNSIHKDTDMSSFQVPQPVRDTPEVTAAKLEFVKAYNDAAIAAALAPDDPADVLEATVTTPNTDEADPNVESNTELGPLTEMLVTEASQNIYKRLEAPVGKFLVQTAHGLIKVQHIQEAEKIPDGLKGVQDVEFKLAYDVGNDGTAFFTQREQDNKNQGFAHLGQTKNEGYSAFDNVASLNTDSGANNIPVLVESRVGADSVQWRTNNAHKDTGVAHVPAPIEDSPESTAKLKFLEAYKAAAGSSGLGDPQFIVLASPKPVKDTPEVTAAKLKFVKAYNAAAIAAATGSTGIGDPQFTVAAGPKPVKDTPEVIAAKLKFVDSYNTAAIAAALAPDDKSVDKDINVAVLKDPKPATGSTGVADAQFTTLVGPKPVKDTPAVTAAKLEFLEAYNTAAIAAALAPDGPGEAVKAAVDGVQTLNVDKFVDSSTKPDAHEPPVQVKTPVLEVHAHRTHEPASLPISPKTKNIHITESVQGVNAAATVSRPKTTKVPHIAPVMHPSLLHVPEPVRDTPEVTAAKLAFVEAYNAAAIAAAAGSTGSEDPQFAIALGPQPVKDTPEVTAAKLDFMNNYNAAALAAALAPDDQGANGKVATGIIGVPDIGKTHETLQTNSHQFSFSTAYSVADSINNIHQKASVSPNSGYLSAGSGAVHPASTHSFPHRSFYTTNNPHQFSFSVKHPVKPTPQQHVVLHWPLLSSSYRENYIVRYTVPYT